MTNVFLRSFLHLTPVTAVSLWAVMFIKNSEWNGPLPLPLCNPHPHYHKLTKWQDLSIPLSFVHCPFSFWLLNKQAIYWEEIWDSVLQVLNVQMIKIFFYCFSTWISSIWIYLQINYFGVIQEVINHIFIFDWK